MNFVEELRWRGMLHDMMPGTEELLAKEQVTAYIGFDPTADSLHIGHLCSVMILRHIKSLGPESNVLVSWNFRNSPLDKVMIYLSNKVERWNIS